MNEKDTAGMKTDGAVQDLACPLCLKKECRFICRFSDRDYYRCPTCELAFVPYWDQLSIEEEVARYDKHQNTSDSSGYVNYLCGVADYVKRIPLENPAILDFGSYKNHVLTDILKERGYECVPYDPCYDIGLDNLHGTYDIIILCEVLEHLTNISREIPLLRSLLKKGGGYLIIRTELYQVNSDIVKWWYTNDETHIFLPSEKTLHLIARSLQREVLYCDRKRYTIIGPKGEKAGGVKR